MSLDFLTGDMETAYYKLISKIESNDNPNAKNPLSTASGRFQFIKSTWEGLGYDWKDVFNDRLQWEAVEKFTAANAEVLRRSGCYLNFATLYGSHFLGVSGFLKIMRANPNDPITVATSAAQRRANPTILYGTVKDFTDWLEKKTGHKYNVQYGHLAPKPVDPVKEKESGRNQGAAIGAIAAVIAFVAAKIFGIM